MSEHNGSLVLWATVDPPVASVADPEVDLAILVGMETRADTGKAFSGMPLHLAITLVGPPKPTATGAFQTVIDSLSGDLRRSDTLSLAGGITARMSDLGAREALRTRIPQATASASPTLAAALEAGREVLTARRSPNAASRLFVVVTAPVIEQVEQVTSVAARLEEGGIGFDIFATSSAVDMGLLIRLANVAGGEVAMTSDVEELGGAMRARLKTLQRQWTLDARIELDFTAGVRPGQMFRVAPSPVFLGNVRLTPSDRTLVIDPGPIIPGGEPTFLLTANVPRRQVGSYRLIESRIRHRRNTTRVEWSGAVAQRCSNDPLEVSSVEAAVMCLRDRVEPLAWVEEAARSQADGEHRRVSSTLDRMLRRFLELGRTDEAKLVGDIRSRYLRSGILDRVELNRLRYAAIQGAKSV